MVLLSISKPNVEYVTFSDTNPDILIKRYIDGSWYYESGFYGESLVDVEVSEIYEKLYQEFINN